MRSRRSKKLWKLRKPEEAAIESHGCVAAVTVACASVAPGRSHRPPHIAAPVRWRATYDDHTVSNTVATTSTVAVLLLLQHVEVVLTLKITFTSPQLSDYSTRVESLL